MTRLTAGEVTEGDALLDLDNGYVFEVEDRGFETVRIYFHDAEGCENHLEVGEHFFLNVKEGEPV